MGYDNNVDMQLGHVMGVFPTPGNFAFVEGVGRKRSAVEEVPAAVQEHEAAHAYERAHS
jgi:hypothetical protein